MTELLSQSAYAQHCGVGRSAVSNWKKDGLLIMVGKKVDVAASDAMRAGSVDPGKGRPRTSDGSAASPPAASGSGSGGPAPGRTAKTRTGQRDRVSSAAEMPDTPRTLEKVRMELVEEQRIAAAQKNAVAAGELAPVIAMERLLTEAGRMFLSVVKARLRGTAEKLAKADSHRAVMTLLDSTIDKAGAEVADRLEALRQDSE